MKLEIYFDLLCPFSWLSKRSLDLASERSGVAPDVAFRPFLLQPNFPRARHDFKAAFVNKYGDERRVPMWDSVIERGKAVGLDYRFYDIEHGFNSVDGHRAVLRAQGQGLGPALMERLFRAFFTECQYLGDLDLLARLSGEVGCDEEDMRLYLHTEEDLDTVYALSEKARARGVSGVPTHVVDGRFWQPRETNVAAYEALLRQAA